MARTQTVIMNDGIECLIRTLGVIDTEKFICNILSEQHFDYSQWRETFFENKDIRQFIRDAALYESKSDNK